MLCCPIDWDNLPAYQTSRFKNPGLIFEIWSGVGILIHLYYTYLNIIHRVVIHVFKYIRILLIKLMKGLDIGFFISILPNVVYITLLCNIVID